MARGFDIYRKVPKDLTQPTYTGAFISICCCVFMLFLFLSELTGFIATEIVNELYVDDPDKDSGGKIDVSLNISLPNLHCDLVGLDIQDEMGRHEVGHIDNSMKVPLSNGYGCRFEGEFSINKVPGNFHVSTHSATAQPQNPDMTHIIHKLAFGEKLLVQNVQGAFNALGGANRLESNETRQSIIVLRNEGYTMLEDFIQRCTLQSSKTEDNWIYQGQKEMWKARCTTKQEDKYIRVSSLRNRRLTCPRLTASLNSTCSTPVSCTTVKRRLRSAGLMGRIAKKKPLLKQKNKKKRLEWAKKHRHWTTDNWKRVLWILTPLSFCGIS
ncbi:endoplasmic reticulum-Golgi intermediate compartment protein 1-like isoform X2 [Myxocyprinus asiaticus]|uniref:endoplasmic reticulum-Golgi intermediate compartment protein 1-like isoform X2 n=1 Tax=Myxocyprinus asiaticus TaxID=70543 RepID=UPI0022222F98|nr:endoplasmic reticulum-Golgi intermediate compartment protein 1-like isoform X2 [Myxocyprinus asiaticus]